MNILMTICGRAGSKGLKGKNLMTFKGHPLIHYTLSAIDLFKKVVDADIDVALNTDSEELKDMIHNYPEILIVERKSEFATDTASKISVIKDSYLECKKIRQKEYDYVIDLDLTSPLRTVSDILRLLEKKISQPELDVVFSVVPSRRNPFFNMVKEEGSYVTLVNNSSFTARQQAPSIYDMNASMYLYDTTFLDNKEAIFDGVCGIIEMKDYLILDIDSEEDFEWMSYLYERFLLEDEGLNEIRNNIGDWAKNS